MVRLRDILSSLFAVSFVVLSVLASPAILTFFSLRRLLRFWRLRRRH